MHSLVLAPVNHVVWDLLVVHKSDNFACLNTSNTLFLFLEKAALVTVAMVGSSENFGRCMCRLT